MLQHVHAHASLNLNPDAVVFFDSEILCEGVCVCFLINSHVYYMYLCRLGHQSCRVEDADGHHSPGEGPKVLVSCVCVPGRYLTGQFFLVPILSLVWFQVCKGHVAV